MDWSVLPFNLASSSVGAGLGTWLYRISHGDFDSTALEKIGPGSIHLLGQVYNFDGALEVPPNRSGSPSQRTANSSPVDGVSGNTPTSQSLVCVVSSSAPSGSHVPRPTGSHGSNGAHNGNGSAHHGSLGSSSAPKSDAGMSSHPYRRLVSQHGTSNSAPGSSGSAGQIHSRDEDSHSASAGNAANLAKGASMVLVHAPNITSTPSSVSSMSPNVVASQRAEPVPIPIPSRRSEHASQSLSQGSGSLTRARKNSVRDSFVVLEDASPQSFGCSPDPEREFDMVQLSSSIPGTAGGVVGSFRKSGSFTRTEKTITSALTINRPSPPADYDMIPESYYRPYGGSPGSNDVTDPRHASATSLESHSNLDESHVFIEQANAHSRGVSTGPVGDDDLFMMEQDHQFDLISHVAMDGAVDASRDIVPIASDDEDDGHVVEHVGSKRHHHGHHTQHHHPPQPRAQRLQQHPSHASLRLRDVAGDGTARSASVPATPTTPSLHDQAEFAKFHAQWQSLPWFTYRTGLDFAEAKSDTGWGCMHRTGQMLVARGYLAAALGAGMNVATLSSHSQRVYRAIRAQFEDNDAATFSLQNICRAGWRECGQKIGSWYGPSTIARILALLNEERRKSAAAMVSAPPTDATRRRWERGAVAGGPLVPDVVVLNATNCTVYVDQVLRAAQKPLLADRVATAQDCGTSPKSEMTNGQSDESAPWTPVILLIPVKLGGDHFVPSYAKNIVDLFSWRTFLGIAGGRPGSSLYFVGSWTDPPTSAKGPSDGGVLKSNESTLWAIPQATRSSSMPMPASSNGARVNGATSQGLQGNGRAGIESTKADHANPARLLYLDPHLPQPVHSDPPLPSPKYQYPPAPRPVARTAAFSPPSGGSSVSGQFSAANTAPGMTAGPSQNPASASYHTAQVRALQIQELDPSMMLGFLLQSRADLDDLVDRAGKWVEVPEAGPAPFFVRDACDWPLLPQVSPARSGQRHRADGRPATVSSPRSKSEAARDRFRVGIRGHDATNQRNDPDNCDSSSDDDCASSLAGCSVPGSFHDSMRLTAMMGTSQFGGFNAGMAGVSSSLSELAASFASSTTTTTTATCAAATLATLSLSSSSPMMSPLDKATSGVLAHGDASSSATKCR